MPAKNNAPRLLTHNGKTQSLDAWAAETGIPQPTIAARIDRLKWPVAKALTTPPAARFAHSRGRPQKGGARSAPQLKRHARGQAYVKWMDRGKRRHRYFGPWGSAQAREGYAQFLREWSDGLSRGQEAAAPAATGASVAALVGKWLDHAKAKYVKLGRQTSEYHAHRAACAVLLGVCPRARASEFGLVELEKVRAAMIRKNWTRRTVNKYTVCVVSMFGWGVPRKFVPAEVHYALQQIEPLAPGASAAAEAVPVRSVPPGDLAAVLDTDHLHPDPGRRATLAAMIRVQILTGMRPAELCAVRAEDVDRTGPEWRYVVPAAANKNFHRGKVRAVWLGPRAQAILGPLLAAGGYAFTFPVGRGKKVGRRPVSRCEYARLVRAACERAGVPPWHPHQLRHNRATELKHRYESDATAARGIGATEDVTARIYCDPHEAADRRIARETG
jgi:integrase